MLRSGIQLAVLLLRVSFKGEQQERRPWNLHKTKNPQISSRHYFSEIMKS
jgi:hypothetical protein